MGLLLLNSVVISTSKANHAVEKISLIFKDGLRLKLLSGKTSSPAANASRFKVVDSLVYGRKAIPPTHTHQPAPFGVSKPDLQPGSIRQQIGSAPLETLEQ